jgi:phospho-N-acetylmuramoyl-pentapeptide-transferase
MSARWRWRLARRGRPDDRQWLLLPLIAAIPVVEVRLVVLQVSYFRLTHGRRLFRMTPLHHHFELGGWCETQVVQRFWLWGF